MSTVPKIVVLGAGFAGLTLVSRLNSLAAEGLAEVTLIEKNASLSIGGLFQFVLRDEIAPELIPISYANGAALKCEHTRFLADEVVTVDVANKLVFTRSETLPYDYLAITSGAWYVPEIVPGLRESAYHVGDLGDVLQLKEALKRFKGGNVVMCIPRTPYKCPTVPQEYILILETLIREMSEGIRDKSQFVFVTEADGPFPMTGFFRERFEQFGIKSVTFAPLSKVDVRVRTLHFSEGRDGNTADPMSYDLLLATFPLAAHQAFADLCDETGLVPSDPRTLKTQWDGVWAFGDCAGMRLSTGPLHPKAGAFAMCQAQALASNLTELVRTQGAQDAGVENLGIGRCDAEVGNHEGTSVSVNLMGGPSSQFQLGPVNESAVEAKLDWIRDCLRTWFKAEPPF
jgi:sulfide:quinone oxidoreductase